MITAILLYGLLILSNVIICNHIWKYFVLRKKLKNIPSPTFFPFFGFIWQLLSKPKEDQSRWLTDLCLSFKEGILLLWIGTEPRLIVNTPKYAEKVLSSNKLITKAKSYDIVKPWLGDGLVMSTGDHWQRHRRMLTPAFHFKILEEYSLVMQKKIEIFLECIETQISKNEKKSINIFELSINYALDTICEAAMGVNMNYQRNPTSEYVQALHRFAALSMERLYSFWLRSDAVYFHTSKGKEALRCVKIMHDFSEKVIKQRMLERRKEKATNGNAIEIEKSGTRKPKTFLDLLLDESEKDKNPLTFKEIREEVDTVIFGGHDTSSLAITWSLFTLGNAPEIQTKVHDELKEVFGDETAVATLSQLSELKYLDRVIKEVLRLYPSGPTTSRYVNEDIVLAEHYIPAGTTITCSFYQIHHNPEVWEDPEKFDPDRFLPENIRSKSPYAYLPFSAGPRNCIGQKFALMEIKLVLTAILRKWKVESVLKLTEMNVVQHIVLKPCNENVQLYFTPVK